MSRFENQVVIVTGASGALGSAVVRAFQAEGATLVLVDRNLDRLEDRFADLTDSDKSLFVSVDLTEESSVAGMVYEVLDRFNRIDVLINVVGGYSAGTPVHDTSTDTWAFMFKLNADTTFLTSRAVVPTMIEQQHGKIVNIASRAGMAGGKNSAAYSASKAVVIRLTESMAAELKAHGINVNSIMPSTIDTPANRDAMPNADPTKWVAPQQLADVILFLCSEQAAAIHGANIPVYGLS